MPTENSFSEYELQILTSNGDEQAFGKIFHIYKNKVYTVAFRLTRSEQAAEEIVQDVFLKLWLKRSSLGEVKDLGSWIFIICRNVSYTFLRAYARRSIHIPALSSDFFGLGKAADERVLEKELDTYLKEAISKLPPQQKLVYELSKLEGYKQEEIATRLNIAPETVKKHLKFAMRSIRAYLFVRLDLWVFICYVWDNW